MSAEDDDYQDESPDDDDSTTDQQPVEQKTPNWRRKLEAEAREAKAAKAERDAAQRELAMFRAGLDPEANPQHRLFLKAYDGDMSKEAIVKAMADYGIAAAGQQTAQQPNAAEQAAHQAMSDVAAGAQAPAPTPDTRERLKRAAEAGDPRTAGQRIMEELNRMGRPTTYDGNWAPSDR